MTAIGVEIPQGLHVLGGAWEVVGGQHHRGEVTQSPLVDQRLEADAGVYVTELDGGKAVSAPWESTGSGVAVAVAIQTQIHGRDVVVGALRVLDPAEWRQRRLCLCVVPQVGHEQKI